MLLTLSIILWKYEMHDVNPNSYFIHSNYSSLLFFKRSINEGALCLSFRIQYHWLSEIHYIIHKNALMMEYAFISFLIFLLCTCFVINEILIWLAYPKGITDRAKNILNNDKQIEKTTFFVLNFIVIIIHIIILLRFMSTVL